MFSMLEVIKREKKYIRLESFFQRFLRSYDFIKNKILENWGACKYKKTSSIFPRPHLLV